MISSAVLINVLGILQLMSVKSAPIEHEPVKIVINENFNSQPGFVVQKWPYSMPSFAHQTGHFYFYPQLQLYPDYASYYTQGLMPPMYHPLFVAQNTNSDEITKNNRITKTPTIDLSISQPIVTVEEDTKPHIPDIAINSEALTMPDLPSMDAKPVVILEDSKIEDPLLFEESMPSQSKVKMDEVAILSSPAQSTVIVDIIIPETKSVNIIENSTIEEVISFGVSKPRDEANEVIDLWKPSQSTFIQKEEFKPHGTKFSTISEAPALPELSFEINPMVILNESETENLEFPKESEPIIAEIVDSSLPSKILIEEEIKPNVPLNGVIPDAPVLPELTFDADPVKIIEDSKIENMVLSELSKPTEPEAQVGEIVSVLPPSQSSILEEEIKSHPQEYLVIPEAPVLPEFTFDADPVKIIEDSKIENMVLSELSKPTEPETQVGEVVSVLPPSQSSILIEEEIKPHAPEYLVIPEAPELPELTFDADPVKIIEDSKIENVVFSELSNPTLPEAQAGEVVNILPPSQSTILIEEEIKPHVPQYLVIPEAPVLPEFTFDADPVNIIEDSKIENMVLSELSNPTEPEAQVGEVVSILPPSQSSILIEEEIKAHVPEYVVIPEAPVLPELTFDADPIKIIEDSKIENMVLSELSKPTEPETQVGEVVSVLPPSQSSILIEEEIKPHAPEYLVIPEAPELPELTFDADPAKIIEDSKIENVVFSELSNPTLPAAQAGEVVNILPPSQSTILIEEEIKPHVPQYLVIPEAPVLPEFTFDADPVNIIEDSKIENMVLSELSNPTEPEAQVGEVVSILPPSQSSILIEEEIKPHVPEYVVIPEAPVLPELTFDADPIKIIEDSKIENMVLSELSKPTEPETQVGEVVSVLPPSLSSILIEEEIKPHAPEYLVIPEAPELPELTFDADPVNIIEDSKIENMVLSELSNPTEPEAQVGEVVSILPPSQSSILIEEEIKPHVPEYVVIPEAPVLPELTFDADPIKIIEDSKIENMVLSELSKPTEPETQVGEVVSVLPPSLSSILIEEEIKPHAPEYLVIPEAPELPELTFDADPVKIIEDSKIENVVFSELSNPTLPEAQAGEVVNILPPSQSTILIEEEIKPHPQEYLVIPEAPVLPEFTFDADPVNIIEDSKIENMVLSELSNPTEPEAQVGEVVSILPPSQSSILIEEEIKPHVPEYVVIPEAPVLPELTFDADPIKIIEDSKIENMVLLELSKPTEPEAQVGEIVSVLAPSQSSILEEEIKSHPQEYLVIPEAPVLPEFTFDADPVNIIEDSKIENVVLSELSKPTQPEAQVGEVVSLLPPYQSSILIEEEIKPYVPEYVVIPEAPVLPELTFDADPIKIIEDSKIENVVFSELSNPTFPEAQVGEVVNILPPSQSSILIEEEIKPHVPDYLVIPEAPVLPELTFDVEPVKIIEDSKIENVVLSELSKPTQPEAQIGEVVNVLPPSQSTILIEEEIKPHVPENGIILEAPILPEFDVDRLSIIEDSKIENLVLPELYTPSQSEDKVGDVVYQSPPSQPTAIIEEFKPHVPEIVVIPEAPVLPELTYDVVFSPVKITENSKNEHLVLSEESKPIQWEDKMIKIVDLSSPSQSSILMEYPQSSVKVKEIMDTSSHSQYIMTENESIHPTIIESSRVERPIVTEVLKPTQIEIIEKPNIQHSPEATLILSHENIRPYTSQAAIIQKFDAKNFQIPKQSILSTGNVHSLPDIDKSNVTYFRPFGLKISGLSELYSQKKIYPLVIPKLRNTLEILNPIPIASQFHSFKPIFEKRFMVPKYGLRR